MFIYIYIYILKFNVTVLEVSATFCCLLSLSFTLPSFVMMTWIRNLSQFLCTRKQQFSDQNIA